MVNKKTISSSQSITNISIKNKPNKHSPNGKVSTLS